MMSYRSAADARAHARHIEHAANKLETDAVFTPALREWLGEDNTYSDVAVLSVVPTSPSDFMPNYEVIVKLDDRKVVMTCLEGCRFYEVDHVDGRKTRVLHRDKPFLDLLDEFVTTVLPELNHAPFYAWYWRKAWVAACVGL
jgi:hypothetical protein